MRNKLLWVLPVIINAILISLSYNRTAITDSLTVELVIFLLSPIFVIFFTPLFYIIITFKSDNLKLKEVVLSFGLIILNSGVTCWESILKYFDIRAVPPGYLDAFPVLVFWDLILFVPALVLYYVERKFRKKN